MRRETIYRTDKTDVLIGPNLRLKAAPGLKYQETKKIGSTDYRRYRTGRLAPGSVLGADIVYATDSGRGLWIGLGAAAATLAAGVAGSALLGRRRKPAKRPRAPHAERGKLIDEIALLDRSFEQGSIPDKDYRIRREEMKRKLAELTGP